MNDTILITGATGSTGAQVATQALAGGATRVRATVRNAAAADRLPAGVEPVVADFDDRSSMAAALAGVRRCYLVTPSSESAERQQVDFVQLAAEAGVERIVLLSQLGARTDSPVRFLRYHAVVENAITELGLGHTFLRPNLFFQGLLGLASQVKESGVLPAPIGAARVSAVDVRDIGAVGAAALLEERHDGATYTLTGPQALTHAEMAAELSTASGHEIHFVDVAPEDFAAAVTGVLPPWQVEGLLEDYAHYARGEASEISDVVPAVTGRPARNFAAFAQDYADAF